MATLIYTHAICRDHENSPGHPEQPARLAAIEQALSALEGLTYIDAPKATIAQLERLHDPAYVASIFNSIPATGYRALDPDTGMNAASGAAALRSAGAVIDAVDRVMTGEAKTAFCAGRPPGHHAERNRAMGFCLFNNVALAAAHARAEHGLKRVAVVDFDVHHGNGTQHMFENTAGLFFASSHQSPCSPGTGDAWETGKYDNIVNVPLAPGSGSAAFRSAWSDHILPALRAFDPELLLVSAGFDAHHRDPLAQLRLTTGDFAWIGRQLADTARVCCAGRLVSALEGGYDLDALGESVAAYVEALMPG